MKHIINALGQAILYVLVVSALTFVPIVLYSADGQLIYVFVIGIVILGLCIWFIVAKGKRISIVCAIVIYYIVSSFLLKNYFAIRVDLRWRIWSNTFKNEVLAQTAPAGTLKHIVWDGWGFAAVGNTDVYLVYDPSNSLMVSDGNSSVANLFLLPLGASRVQRLEADWYSVVFYTGTDWDHGG